MYSEDGILNEYNMSLNEDGSFDARFGDCGDVDNHLPTVRVINGDREKSGIFERRGGVGGHVAAVVVELGRAQVRRLCIG